MVVWVAVAMVSLVSVCQVRFAASGTLSWAGIVISDKAVRAGEGSSVHKCYGCWEGTIHDPLILQENVKMNFIFH